MHASTSGRRVLLVHKRTRWDFLLLGLQESSHEAKAKLAKRFPSVFQAHQHHLWAVEEIAAHLKRGYPHSEIVMCKSGEPVPGDAPEFDFIFSAGGDGTFLEAASRLGPGEGGSVRIFGINTDPARSEGRLLVRGATEQARGHWPWPLMKADGSWGVRELSPEQQRRESIRDECCDKVLRSYDKHEQVFALWTRDANDDEQEHTAEESEDMSPIPLKGRETPVTVRQDLPWSEWANNVLARILKDEVLPMRRQRVRVSVYSGDTADSEVSSMQTPSACSSLQTSPDGISPDAVLEERYVALNDAVLLPMEPHSVLHVIASVDRRDSFPAKNSGILVCTGTGSTAWAYNMTRISPSDVRAVLEVATQEGRRKNCGALFEESGEEFCVRVSRTLNKRSIFDPRAEALRYVFREPIFNRSCPQTSVHGFCHRVTARVIRVESQLTLDGLRQVPLPLGSTVVFEVCSEDAIQTGI